MTEEEAIQGQKMSIPEGEPYRYYWIAEYSEGDYFPQFDASGSENLFKDIQQHKLTRFHFVNPTNGHKVSVNITPDMRLVCFRRHRQRHNDMPSSWHVDGHDVFYSLGFQKTIVLNGQEHNVKSIMFIDGDGNVTLTDGDLCQ